MPVRTARSLRSILSLQSILAATLPFFIIALLSFVWLFPQIKSDINTRQRQLATAISSQIEHHLDAPQSAIHASSLFVTRAGFDQDGLRDVLDVQVNATDSLSTLYAVGRDGRVAAVGLKTKNEQQLRDMEHLDLSRNEAFVEAIQSGRPVWSNTFLSVIGGGLSVAYAVPSDDFVIIGEVGLGHLSDFLQHLAEDDNQLIFVVDRDGQVVADQDGRYTAQQMNVSNISLVRKGMSRESSISGQFEFDGQTMIGGIVAIPSVDWHVLVSQPLSRAYRQATMIVRIGVIGLFVALALAIFISLYLDRNLARRFGDVTTLARDIASGRDQYHATGSNIVEFDALAENLRQMGQVIKEREEQLRTAQSILLAALHQSPAGTIIADAPDVGIRLINKAAEEILLPSSDQPSNFIFDPQHKMPWQAFRPDGTEYSTQEFPLARTILAGDSFSNTEIRIVRSDGSERNILVNGSPIYGPGGEIIGGIIVFPDLSGRKNLEEQLRQAQKMEAVGQLAGGVAHDFNNLLQAIMGYGEMALEASRGSAVHSDLEQVIKAAERAKTLVRQLMAFSRKQVLKLEDLDLSEVVSQMTKMIQRVIGEHIAFTLHSEPGLKAVRADKGQIEQILMNLCVNARDAMSESGILTISTNNIELDEKFCLTDSWAQPGRYALLSVTDTGDGMDDETKRRIFEPFFTTKELGKGTGLGLSTVFGIVRQHNGMVNVCSEQGVGTTFRIYFPMLEGTETACEETKGAEPPGGSETILLADDDEGVRGVAQRMLEKAGYRVFTASDGEEAISVFDERADEIDIAVLDVVMPNLGGKAVAEHIQRERPKTRILFASGYSTDAIHSGFVLDESTQLIQKPYQRDEILRSVRKELDS